MLVLSNRRTFIIGTLAELLQDLTLQPKLVRIHGIDIPLETPLIWLARNAAFQDTFLHLLLVEERINVDLDNILDTNGQSSRWPTSKSNMPILNYKRSA